MTTTKTWWAFRPRKKYLAPPPPIPRKHPPGASPPTRPETPPPLLGFSIRNRPLLFPAPWTPPPPPPRKKKISETSTEKRKLFGELFWPQRTTFQVGGGYKNPKKTRKKKTTSTTEIFPLWPPFCSAMKSSAILHYFIYFLLGVCGTLIVAFDISGQRRARPCLQLSGSGRLTCHLKSSALEQGGVCFWIQKGFTAEPLRNDSGANFQRNDSDSGPKVRDTGRKPELQTKSRRYSPASEPNRPEKGPEWGLGASAENPP